MQKPVIKSSAKTKVIDKGFKKAMREIDFAKNGPHVKVGVLGSDNQREGSKLNLAQIATINEFGSADQSIPSRPFLRTTMDQQNRKFQHVTKSLLFMVLLGKKTSKNALKTIGQVIEAAVKKTMTDLRTPANAPSTIARKRSSNPLIDTGRLRASIASRVVNRRVRK